MAPLIKRMRENSNAETKASKGMDMSSILQLINERFKEQAELIASKMSQSEERILSLLHERLDSMSKEMQELCERVQQLERDASVVEALKTQFYHYMVVGLLPPLCDAMHLQCLDPSPDQPSATDNITLSWHDYCCLDLVPMQDVPCTHGGRD
ncbi:hypothetical protein ACLKA7_001015 [Drosophila subpalustris]